MCRAIHQGCIPVTFWVNTDLPYEKGVGPKLDYSKFTVNVTPAQMGYVNAILLNIINDSPRLLAMQQALAEVSSSRHLCGPVSGAAFTT